MRLLYTLFCCLFISGLFGQYGGEKDDEVIHTFRHTRIINAHSVETLPARKLDFRIVHRFGDLVGSNGGFSTFYGLERAADVSIGFEYGVTDNVMVGISRTAGAGPLEQNLNGLFKAKLINQREKGSPLSLAVNAITTYSTQEASPLENQLTSFTRQAHRLSYNFGVQAARKFSDSFSFLLGGSWTVRNLVDIGDQNDIFAVHTGMRIQVTKAFGLILEAVVPLQDGLREGTTDYVAPLAIGFEFDTSGGHVFQLNLTNNRGISETYFIPYTTSRWEDGSFRLGFTISRLFSL
jgi:hypothetical protein